MYIWNGMMQRKNIQSEWMSVRIYVSSKNLKLDWQLALLTLHLFKSSSSSLHYITLHYIITLLHYITLCRYTSHLTHSPDSNSQPLLSDQMIHKYTLNSKYLFENNYHHNLQKLSKTYCLEKNSDDVLMESEVSLFVDDVWCNYNISSKKWLNR